MANYLELMNQMQDRRRVGLAEYNPTNPYDSSAYVYQNSRDIYNQSQGETLNEPFAEGYVPSDWYTPPTTEEKITKGVSNLATSQQVVKSTSTTLGKAGEKYLGGVSQTMPNPAVGVEGHVADVAVGASVPNTAVGASGPIAGVGSSGYAAIGSIAYAMANDNNPYTYDTGEAVGMGVGDAATATALTTAAGVYAPWMPIAAAAIGYLFRSKKAKKKRKQEEKILVGDDKSVKNMYAQNIIKERKKRDYYQSQAYRNTGNSPYGVEDTNIQPSNTGALTAAHGMKYKYNTGGKSIVDVHAEFTGNELIVNNQDIVEAGLKEKNYSKAAAPIRQAMRGGKITPGPETHQNNPMPVTSDGTIYAGGGPLNFKVKSGAGIYDHASDQFKTTMSDKQIAMVAEKNINKWKSNNMYS